MRRTSSPGCAPFPVRGFFFLCRRSCEEEVAAPKGAAVVRVVASRCAWCCAPGQRRLRPFART
uniref:Predicted protein n=1 Tax=Hordeum vulgare subsp. vulgare TaxID=112509 RepID=F2D4H9_HORVV|nr:predicted protein [Hordeum vulgare subsp. vulgare]